MVFFVIEKRQRTYWGRAKGRLELWEFGIRALAALIVLGLLAYTLYSIASGSEWLGLSDQGLKDAALILTAYIVIAIRRERRDWVFVLNMALWLVLAIAWWFSAALGHSDASFILLITTVIQALVVPLLAGPSIFAWQAWPLDSPSQAKPYKRADAGDVRSDVAPSILNASD
ncbi:hypothetical protein [Leifsonia sp. NPDC058230]|uniref:hypothetical protein n=1 Tax=Leifsonia sp. NPDC058230 TaxID=3346391 RepID=UPI0036DDC761